MSKTAAISKAFSFFAIFSLANSCLWAYGSLAEFLSADGNTLRQERIYNSDTIAEPKWAAGHAPIVLQLCTGPTDPNSSFANAPLSFNVSRAAETLLDVIAATNTWNAVTGGPTFARPVINPNCGTNLGLSDPVSLPNGENRISFTNTLPQWILAYTTLHLVANGGNLEIQEADIQFNLNYDPTSGTERFRIAACDSCGGACSALCSNGGFEVTFKGVLTHELGHLLGLSHSEVTDDNAGDGLATAATMFPSITSLSQSRHVESLASDDQLGKLNLYRPSGFPSSSQGTISGHVRSSNLSGLRGAHVYAFNLNTRTTIAGTFSGMSSLYAGSDGSYSIRGIPFDTPFIVVVEPAERPDVQSNLVFDAYNLPIAVALQNEATGWRSFVVEAWPDAHIVDIRKTANSYLSPGVGNAVALTLNSSVPSRNDIDFYVSKVFTAPNDVSALSIEFPSSSTISDANPLRIKLTTVADLSNFADASFRLMGSRGDSSSDWSAGIPHVSLSGTSVDFNIDPTKFHPSDGTYNVTFTVSKPSFGNFSQTKAVQISNWKAAFGGTETAASSGGGCSVITARPFSLSWFVVVLFLSAFYFCRRRIKL